jgi:hypothetical protein
MLVLFGLHETETIKFLEIIVFEVTVVQKCGIAKPFIAVIFQKKVQLFFYNRLYSPTNAQNKIQIIHNF